MFLQRFSWPNTDTGWLFFKTKKVVSKIKVFIEVPNFFKKEEATAIDEDDLPIATVKSP